MSTLTTLADELKSRLGDSANAVWPAAELKDYLKYSIKGLYPTFYRFKVATSTATAGPLQTKPVGCRNLHMVGLKRSTSTRVRPLRGWQEGDNDAFISKTGITGDTLVWGWTEGWDAPAADGDVLTIPIEAEDVVLVRSQIKALERLLADRVAQDRYFNLTVRQAASEADIADTIDGLRQHLNDLTANVVKLPEKRQ
jgi:hypothetical protein